MGAHNVHLKSLVCYLISVLCLILVNAFKVIYVIIIVKRLVLFAWVSGHSQGVCNMLSRKDLQLDTGN